MMSSGCSWQSPHESILLPCHGHSGKYCCSKEIVPPAVFEVAKGMSKQPYPGMVVRMYAPADMRGELRCQAANVITNEYLADENAVAFYFVTLNSSFQNPVLIANGLCDEQCPWHCMACCDASMQFLDCVVDETALWPWKAQQLPCFFLRKRLNENTVFGPPSTASTRKSPLPITQHMTWKSKALVPLTSIQICMKCVSL